MVMPISYNVILRSCVTLSLVMSVYGLLPAQFQNKGGQLPCSRMKLPYFSNLCMEQNQIGQEWVRPPKFPVPPVSRAIPRIPLRLLPQLTSDDDGSLGLPWNYFRPNNPIPPQSANIRPLLIRKRPFDSISYSYDIAGFK